jgi:ElaB/YqjD/DUF883 family membrane-anchored ribosome-binding protein
MLERTAAQGAALADELRNVMRQAEKLVVALSEDKEDALVELRERVAIALGTAKERLAEFEQQAKQFTETAGAAAEDYAREHPWTVVAIGAALGLVLGAWLAAEPAAEES